MSQRAVLRSARAVRSQGVRRLNHSRRQYATQPGSINVTGGQSGSASSSALYGGVAGGTIAFLLGYTWYSFSGAKTIVKSAKQTKDYYNTTKQKLKESTPEPNEALDWIRKQASFYAGFVPGGRGFVDSAFDDIDRIREKHGQEVDKIVKEAYEDLRQVTEKDLSMSTANEAYQILQKHLKRITSLAGDSFQDILNNHPQLQDRIGKPISQFKDQAKDLGGPEATNIVNDTWSQLQATIQESGINSQSISKIQSILSEKGEQLRKLGNQAWEKGMKEAKPYLDKSPKVKELVESNKAKLLSSGKLSQAWDKIKKAAETGDTGELEDFVSKSTSSSGGGGGGGIDSVLNSILPSGASGGQIASQFQQIQQMYQNSDTGEMKKLVKETVEEIEGVLKKRLDQGKKLVDNGKGN